MRRRRRCRSLMEEAEGAKRRVIGQRWGGEGRPAKKKVNGSGGTWLRGKSGKESRPEWNLLRQVWQVSLGNVLLTMWITWPRKEGGESGWWGLEVRESGRERARARASNNMSASQTAGRTVASTLHASLLPCNRWGIPRRLRRPGRHSSSTAAPASGATHLRH